MRLLVTYLAMSLWLFGWDARGHAASLSLLPPVQSVTTGQSVQVDLLVSDLGGSQLGDFDVTLSFDPTFLAPTGVIFDSFLGDPTALKALTAFTFSPGLVHLAETSLLAPAELAIVQSMHFPLAALMFHTIRGGTSALSFSQTILDDALAVSLLPLSAVTGAQVTATPEPSTLWLLSASLLGLFLRRSAGT